jgi:hypothetical protein
VKREDGGLQTATGGTDGDDDAEGGNRRGVAGRGKNSASAGGARNREDGHADGYMGWVYGDDVQVKGQNNTKWSKYN